MDVVRGEGHQKTVTARLSAATTVAVPIDNQRTWQRKWRDVLQAHADLAETYAGTNLDVDAFTRRVETFFKTCRELVDWIAEPDRSQPIADEARKFGGPKDFGGASLKLCDAVAQTAKHHTRSQPGRDPIQAAPVKLHGAGPNGDIRADIEWTRQSGKGGQMDALRLANRCVDEWERFFRIHGLNPTT